MLSPCWWESLSGSLAGSVWEGGLIRSLTSLGNWGVQFSFPKLNNGRWDFDILAFFQAFLTLNQVVDAVNHQLDQLHLETHSNRIVAQTGRYIELMHVSLLAWKRKLCKGQQKNILTSDLPRRSRLEMSKVSPVAAVSTPPVPRFCSRRLSRILLKRGSCKLESFITCWNFN